MDEVQEIQGLTPRTVEVGDVQGLTPKTFPDAGAPAEVEAVLAEDDAAPPQS